VFLAQMTRLKADTIAVAVHFSGSSTNITGSGGRRSAPRRGEPDGASRVGSAGRHGPAGGGNRGAVRAGARGCTNRVGLAKLVFRLVLGAR
jgi:hypothetical protein